MKQELLYLNRCKNTSPSITNKIAKQLHSFFLISFLIFFSILPSLHAQDVSNDPNSINFSPADFVAPEQPGDSIFIETSSLPKKLKKTSGKGPIQIMALVTWTGGGDGVSWNDAANWSGGSGIPTSSDDVTLGTGDNVQLISGSDGVCKSITIQSGGSLVIGSMLRLTVSDSVNVQSGGSLSNSGEVYLQGNWLNSGSVFSNGGSVVRFNGADQTIEATNFSDLQLYGSGTKTALGDLDIDDDLLIANGVSFDPGTYDIYITDDFQNNGTLIQGSGNSAFIFDGTEWQSVYSNQGGSAIGTWNFNDIEVVGNAGGIGVYDSITVYGDVTVGSSEYLYLVRYNITTPSDGIITGSGTNSLTFAANSSLVIQTQRANGSGGTDDNFPHSFETVSFATGVNSSICYYRSSNSNTNQIIRTTDGDGTQITYGRLRLDLTGSATSSTKTLDGNLDVGQYIYAESGVTFTSNNNNINLTGNWNNDGSFVAGTGTVTFDGEYQYIQGDATTTFYDLVFAGTQGKILQQNVLVSNSCLVSSGVTYLNLDVYTLNDAGSNVEFEMDGTAILYVRSNSNFPDFDLYDFSSTSTVRYDRNGNQDVVSGITYGNLYLGNGGRKDLEDVNDNMTVAGNLQIATGTEFEINSTPSDGFTLNLSGDFLNQGTLTDNSDDGLTIVLNGSEDASFNTGGTGSGQELLHLTVNKDSQDDVVTLNNNMLLNGDFTLTRGKFGSSTYNRNIEVQGNWATALGTEFIHGNGTVYFTGSSAQSITASGNGDFWNVELSGGGTKTLAADGDINNNLTITSTGDLNLGSGDLYVGDNFDNNNGGSFDPSGQTVILDGSSNSNFYIGSTDSLYHLTVNKSGGAYVNYDEHDLKIGGNVSLQSGEFRRGYNSSTSQYTDLIVYGNWSNTGGTMLANANDTVFFAGAAQDISGSGTNDFDNVVFGGTGTKTISGNVDANRSINIESGVTVSVSGTNTLKVGRDFVNNGTFTANNSTLVFEEYAGWGSVYLTTNGSPLHNLQVNLYDTDYELYLQDDLDANGNITITKGALDVTGTDYSINCGGSWTVESLGRFIDRNGMVIFDGASGAKAIQSNGYNFYEVAFNSNNSIYTLQDDLQTLEDVDITNGQLDLNSYALYVGNGSGDSLIVRDSIIVDDNAQLRMASTSQISVENGGTIIVNGSSGNPATVTNQGSGTYAFDIQSGGTIASGYYTFEFMDADGVNVKDGAIVDGTLDFSNGVFTNGTSGGTLLTLDNNQNLGTITGVSFPTNPGGGANNVTKSLNQGSATFQDASGAFQGASYESDAFGLITWNYTTSEFTWEGDDIGDPTNWNVGANWDIGSVPGSGNRVVIPSTSNDPVISSTTDSCYHVTIQNGATLTLGSGSGAYFVVTGDMNIESGGTLTFADANDTLEVQGNWSNSGTFTHNSNGLVMLSGSEEQSINPGGTGSGKTFSHLMVNKEAGNATLAGALQADIKISLVDGTFDVSAGNYAITANGSWMKTDTASFNAQAGTVTFTRNDSVIYGSGTNDFNNLTISADVDLGGSLDINGNLTINSGDGLDVSTNNYGITLEGNWTNNGGTFTSQSGNVILDGSSTQNIQGSASTTFNNLTIESDATVNLNVNANVNGTFSVNTGRFDLESGNTLNGSGASNLFILGDDARLRVYGNNFPTGFEGFSLDQNSFVRYILSGDQDVVGQDASGGQISYGYLYLESSGTKTAVDTLDVNNTLYIANNVTFDLNSKDLSLEFYWDNNQGGSFTNTGSAGTVTLDREGTQYFYPNTTTGDTLNNIVFAGSGAKVLSGGNIVVTGDVTLNTGVSYLNLQNYTLTGEGSANGFSLSSNVTLYVRGSNNFPTHFEAFNLAQNSIVRYDGNLNQTITTYDQDGDQIQYGDIYFQRQTKTLDSNLDVRGQFYNYAGTTLDCNDHNINIGEYYYNLGTIDFGSNTVTFDGGDDQRLYSYGTSASKAFNHLRINKSGNSQLGIYTYDVKVDSNVIFDGGVIYNANRTITVGGNWTAASGAIMFERTGNVTFNGSKQVITTGGDDDFYDVNFTGSDTTFLGSNIEVLNDLSISGSNNTLDVTANNYTISIYGDYTNNDYLSPRNGTIEFKGTATQYINTGGANPTNEAFYNLMINKASGTAYLGNDMLVLGSVNFAGSVDASANFRFNGNDMEVKGSWYNPNAVYVSANNGNETITFSGTSKDTIQSGFLDSRQSDFHNVVINHTDSIIHIDDIRVDGNYAILQGEVYLNGNTFYYGTTDADYNFELTNGSGPSLFDLGAGGKLNIRRGNNIVIGSATTDTSVFRVVGTNDNVSEVSNWAWGRYSFSVNNGGRIYARHYRFSYMDTSGVNIDGGVIAGVGADTTEDFSNGSFAFGENEGKYLYINNDQTLQIDSVSFVNTIGGSSANVEKPNATGSLTFFNATGEFAGEDYEEDPNGLINWTTVASGFTWDGSEGTDWHDGDNWSGASVPTSNDDVIIPSSVTNFPLISNSDAVCKNLTIQDDASLDIGGSRDLDVNGRLYIDQGTLTIYGVDTVYIGGDYINTGIINPGQSTLYFDGEVQKLNTGGTNNNYKLYNLHVACTELLLEDNLQTNNDVTIAAGSQLDLGDDRHIYVKGDWSNSGTLDYQNGSVTFNGESAQTVTGSGTDDFYNVYFSASGEKTLANEIDVENQFRINSGATVNGGSCILKLNEDFENFGAFNGENGTVNFDGTGTSTVEGDSIPSFHNLILSNGGNKVLYTNIEVDSLFLIQSGVNYLNLQTYSVNGTGSNDSLYLDSGVRIYVRGSNNFPSGFSAVSLHKDSYVRFDADITQTVRTIDDDSETFSYGYLELLHTSSGSRKLLDGHLVSTNRIYINDPDTLDVSGSNYNITCGGRFDLYGYLLADGSNVQNTLTLNGQGNFYFTPGGSGTGKEFHDILVNVGSGNTLIFAGTEELVCNDFTINSGDVNPNGNRDITIGGSFVVNSGEFLGGGSHITFVGSGNETLKANSSELNLVTLNSSGSNLNLSLGDQLNMDNNLIISSGDTLSLNGNTFNFGDGSDAITVNGVLDIDAGARLQMANTSSLLVNSGGRLNVVGQSGNIAQITRQSGDYSVEVQGTIAAKYYTFEYMDEQGLYINGGTIDTDNNFSYGTFTNGATNGKYLNLYDVDQKLTGSSKIVEVQFPSQPGGTSYNVYRTGSAATDSILIEDASGTFEGEDFEYDPNNNVIWEYTSVTRYWAGTTNSNWHLANNWSPKAVPDENDDVVITSKSNLPIIQDDSAKCKDLEIQSGSLTLKNGHVLDVVNGITISSGAQLIVDSQADTVVLSGNWTNNGNYTHGNSMVVFDGTNSQNLVSGGTTTGKRFYNLKINKDATSSLSLSNDIYVEKDIEIASGRLDAGSRDITIKGDWKNSGGEFVNSNGQVTFVGSETDTITTNGDSFYDLSINASSGNIIANDNIRVENDLIINAGTFDVNAKTISVGSASGDKLSIQGTMVLDENSTVQLQGGSSGLQVESGGVLQSLGVDGNTAEITRYGSSGYYPVILNSGGQISAKHTKFSYTNGSGVWVKNGAGINLTNKLDSCEFENGTEASYLRISNGQTLGTINGVTFSAVGSTPSNNVIYDGFGSVLFDNYSGGFSGARHENDNGSDPVGNVRWTFTETQSVSAGNTYTFGNDFEITVNTVGSPALNQITVQLLDEQYNSLTQTYNRYYVITTNAGASGYTTTMKLYYADGSSGSNNEVPESGSDSDPKVWYKQSDLFPAVLFEDGNNTTQNWAQANTSGDINGNWFISEQSDESALPVELMAYNIENVENGISINWTTATEIDNLGFILERSTEPDKGFKQIASYLSTNALKGQGTISAETNYNYVDYGKFLAGQTYYYRLSDVDISGKRNVLETKSITRPEAYSLHQNYPNPFNPTTTIQFSLERAGKTVLEVYDILGRKVTTLVNQQMKAGAHIINWNARNYASGVYFYRLQSGNFTRVKKMMLVK